MIKNYAEGVVLVVTLGIGVYSEFCSQLFMFSTHIALVGRTTFPGTKYLVALSVYLSDAQFANWKYNG
jgi:hypothetical protein